MDPVSGDGGARRDELIAAMPLREALAQLFVIHVYGSSGDEPDQRMREVNLRLYGAPTPATIVERLRPGGVILLRRNGQDRDRADLPTGNVESLPQLAALTRSLQDAAAGSGTGTGLLVAVDQEGGPVTHLPPPAGRSPGGAVLGATRDAELAREAALATGRELADVGINVNLAPVADVNTNPHNPVIGGRAFGSDPVLVSRMVEAQIVGYRQAGIAATAKHFPGHGHSSEDSHVTLPVVDLPRRHWERVHMRPFETAVKAGVDAVMTAHISAPSLDGTGTPATFSRPIVGGLLRGRLGFEGVIMTDSLWMEGARALGDDLTVALSALAAGADILLMPPFAADLLDALVGAVGEGRLDGDRVRESVRRVLLLKQRLGVVRETATLSPS